MTEYDPTAHTVTDVQAYVADHPDELAEVVAKEAARSDGTEPRKTILALAPDAGTPQTPTVTQTPPAPSADQPPTAGSEPTWPTAGAAESTTLTGSGDQQDGAEAELAGYYDRLEALTADQRAALEQRMDDGTDWSTMRDDPVVRARFGAHLTQAEAQVTPQTGTFRAPQDERADDGSRRVQGSAPSQGQAYDEDGNTVNVADVRGEATVGQVAPARGDAEPDADQE